MAFALRSRISTVSRSAGSAKAPKHSARPVIAVRGRSVVARATVTKEEVLKDVQTIIATQLGVDVEKVDPTSSFASLGADSLDTVEIMMALEEKWNLQLTEEGAENIKTVEDAAGMIAKTINSK